MESELWIPGLPRPKERPRATKGGKIYTPPQTKKREAAIAAAWLEAGLPRLEGPCTVELIFALEGTRVIVRDCDYPSGSMPRGDLDNLTKLVLDGLNKVAYKDDRYVLGLHAVKV